MAKIQPLADRVVAEPMEATEKTSAGLYLPANAKEKPQTAKVVAVGPKVKEIKTGDVILYKEYSGKEVKLDNTDYVVVDEEDVLAVIK